MKHSGLKAESIFENEDSMNSKSDNEDSVQDDEKEEIELDNQETEYFMVNQEKKRKKITDELTEIAPKKKKKLEKNLYKQPTVEELSQLRETENLFHSNLFRLQIEEILNEVRLKNKYKALFEIWFGKLKAAIESIEETEEVPLVDNNLGDKLGICIPVLNIPKETKSVFKFLKPSNISVVGSYNSGCILGSIVTVDIMVEMPADLFRKQDYQNYVYFRKKATYLAFVASNIGSDIAETKKFIGDNLRPSLKLRPSGRLNKKIDVVIHISAQESSFKLNRFLPEKNSIRPAWYFNNKRNSSLEDTSLPPTPNYNSLVLHDLVMLRINSEVAQAIKEYPNLRDGIILLKIWLRQRELNKGYDGFTSHIITMFVIYLLREKKLNTFMSSYQIVRNVWICLAQGNWCQSGITMFEDKDSQNQISHYHRYYDCVFLDTSGYCNFAANLSKDTFSWVQREASLCLKYVDNIHVDSFHALFMRNVPFHRAFDHILCFQDNSILEITVNAKSTLDNKLNYGPDKRSQAIKLLFEVLKRGLGDRINRLCVLPNVCKEWECNDEIPDSIGKLVIGLELNPETCFNIVDKGPEANLSEAVDFRNFWGDKSELRRFKDGAIREAVIWSKGKTLADKRIICKRIIIFLLKTKFNISRNQYLYVAEQMEDLLELHKYKITHFVYGTGEEATLKVLQAFSILEKNLMSLNDMPLTINGVQGSSPVFRYAEIFPPLATVHRKIDNITEENKNCLSLSKNITKCPTYVHALDVTLQLSTSGKWPEELEAIKKTKAAFHIQIAECLRTQHSLTVQANPSYVDVYQNGFVFRLRVAHQKEIALMKQVKEDGVIKYRDNEESIELENKLFHLPKLSSALHGLHSQQPSFGPACCLAKRWLSAQLLDDTHIPGIVVELLMASLYLAPEPYKPAQTPQTAFLRFLEIVARAHWNTDPVIVNFNGEMTNEEITAVETLFNTARSSLPPLFISTPYDQQKILWTRKAPSHLVLNRMSVLAKESLKLFDDLLFNNIVLDVKPIFRPPLLEYDCLLHLKSRMIPRKLQAVDTPSKAKIVDLHPYKAHSLQKIPVVDFDPIQCFLKDLRDGYGDYALFFHDTYGGTVIGVLLKPAVLERKDFKVSDANCRKLDANGKLVLNISTMIEDFYILGRGIIRTIDIPNRKKFSLTSESAI
ncbi:PREDICTED: nucleolar protein 6 [Cyphomyrmex costatus]|uniref:nucleolar protein 6 n=1 Tax=Cyphomyrmex costatus TaxID=456900 RepID=UPI0008523A8A|nr:PREDICTED: nucleolar protein 6 [Cyphomyrmex costatus]XP_018401183.1 PREDICTED: nucleolar protein 6 [Cyphomyrmex costatus]XP_018401184.1 PREDICTED: nucleolar protein 6 [Cyphomyrmex costatus]